MTTQSQLLLQQLAQQQARIKQQQQGLFNQNPNAGALGMFSKIGQAYAYNRKLKDLADKQKEVSGNLEKQRKEALSGLLVAAGLEDPKKPSKLKLENRENFHGGSVHTGQVPGAQPGGGTVAINPGAVTDPNAGNVLPTTPPQPAPPTLAQALSNPYLPPQYKQIFIQNILKKQQIKNQQDFQKKLLQQKYINQKNLLSAKTTNNYKPQSPVGKAVQDYIMLRGLSPRFAKALENQINQKSMGGLKTPQGKRPVFLSNGQFSHFEKIPGAKRLPVEQASKIVSMVQSKQTIQRMIHGGHQEGMYGDKIPVGGIFYKEKYTDKNGKVRYRTAVKRVMISNIWGRVPGTDGAYHRSAFDEMIQTKLRIETGAAAPDHEVENIFKRYMPKPLDNVATVTSKLKRFEKWINGTLALTDQDVYRTMRLKYMEKDPRYKGLSNDQKMIIINKEVNRGGIINLGSTFPDRNPGTTTDSGSIVPTNNTSIKQSPNKIAYPKTKADYDKLPKGTRYQDPKTGKEYIKQ